MNKKDNIITLYHGSDHIIESPRLGKGKKKNDYGYGFYCTEHLELAKEWASKTNATGIVNEYSIDLTNMKILDLTKKEYNILNWLAILLNNRIFTLTTPISIEAKAYILDKFSIDTSEYDVIRGYRADDSYFSFAEDFLNNSISVEQLSEAMQLGDLGIQYAIVSEKGFDALQYIGNHIAEDKYHNAYKQRDIKARDKYSAITSKNVLDGLYVRDIIKENIENGDQRI